MPRAVKHPIGTRVILRRAAHWSGKHGVVAETRVRKIDESIAYTIDVDGGGHVMVSEAQLEPALKETNMAGVERDERGSRLCPLCHEPVGINLGQLRRHLYDVHEHEMRQRMKNPNDPIVKKYAPPTDFRGVNMASHVGLEVPSVEEVVKELKAIKREMIHGDVDEGGLEIRLQVLTNGNWTVHYGDPGFDTDHHGFWGASSLGGGETVEELEQIAKDLISDVEESAAQSDEGDDDDEDEDFEGHDERRLASKSCRHDPEGGC